MAAAAAASSAPADAKAAASAAAAAAKLVVPALRVLSEADVEKALSMRDAIAVNAQAFAAAARGTAVVPDRILINGSTPADGSTLFKPAAIDGGHSGLGLKIVSVRPGNGTHGLPTVPAVIVLLDQDTGLPVSVMGATYLTALRTAAGSGVATDLFSHANSAHVVVFGAGMQARAHVDAVLCVRPSVVRVTIVNRSLNGAQKLCDELAVRRAKTGAGGGAGGASGAAAVVVKYDAIALNDTKAVNTALATADIVCACTNASTPLFDGTHLKKGAHVNGVGSYRPDMQELDTATVTRAHIVLDSKGALGAGDLSVPLKAGAITALTHVRGELGEFVAGSSAAANNNSNTAPLKTLAGSTPAGSAADITLFKSVGVAVQDIATAHAVLIAATKLGLGTTTPLA